MGVKGKSFTGSFSGGARVDFSVGTLAAMLEAGWTIAALSKSAVGSSNNGFFGGYSASDASAVTAQSFISNNTHGRLFGNGDFSSGYPSSTELPNGLDDDVVRWIVLDKGAGTSHYGGHYADLSTLTWSHGESAGAGNHNDITTASVLFSTWAVYSMGFSAQETYAIAVWDHKLTNTQIEDALTHKASDLLRAAPNFFVLFDDEFGSVRSNWTPPNVDTSLLQRDVGFKWSTTKAVTIDGLLWYHTNDSNAPTAIEATIYKDSDQSVVAGSGSVSTSGFSAGQWNLIPLTALFVPTIGTDYVASVHLEGSVRYDPDDLASSPLVSGEGWITVPAHGSRFHNSSATPVFPDTSYDGFFGVDLNYYIPKVELMGTGADETHRQFVVPTLNPVDYDFTLGSPHTAGQFLPFFQ
jgi:hypothetical protein